MRQSVRIGAYGDPYAVPENIWRKLFKGRSKIKHRRKDLPDLGWILYRGPSMFDPKTEIVLIATRKSKNDKTGNMIQTWILLVDKAPHKATKDLKAICGGCLYRHDLSDKGKGGCYVLRHNAPLSIWRSFNAGRYSTDTDQAFDFIADQIDRYGYTGYSEGSIRFLNSRIKEKAENAEFLASKIMLSAKSEIEALELQRKGFKTFRPVGSLDEMIEGETLCESDKNDLQCEECLKCDAKNGSIVVLAHGAKKNTVLHSIGSLKRASA
jgi:hypothetical protein